jgi:hypothetical protein
MHQPILSDLSPSILQLWRNPSHTFSLEQSLGGTGDRFGRDDHSPRIYYMATGSMSFNKASPLLELELLAYPLLERYLHRIARKIVSKHFKRKWMDSSVE